MGELSTCAPYQKMLPSCKLYYMKPKVPLILRSTTTDLDYAEYFAKAGSGGLREALNEPQYTVGATSITYRVMTHWGQVGLLPPKDEDLGWRRFSLIERVWIEAVKKMRTYGIPLEVIAGACDQVMRKGRKGLGYPNLEYFVMSAWRSQADPHIMILEDGRTDVGSMEEIELSKDAHGQSMLLISLKQILGELGFKVKEAKKLVYLTENEAEVLRKIRLEGNDAVSVKVAADGKISDIQTVRTTNEKPTMRDLLEEMEKEDAYGQISVSFVDGKPRSSKVMKKKRLK